MEEKKLLLIDVREKIRILVARINSISNEINRINKSISARKEEYQQTIDQMMDKEQKEMAPIINTRQKEIEQAFLGIYQLAQTHEKELITDAGKKTIDVTIGQIYWHLNPPAVSIRSNKHVVANCERLGLDQFIRIIKEPNKEAMLEKPDLAKTVPGVKIKQDEIFGITSNFLSKPLEKTVAALKEVLKKQLKKTKK